MTEAAAAATPKEPKVRKRGVGTVINEALLAGKSNEEALEAVKAEFPDSKTNINTISWYRNNLRKEGHDVPKARAAKKASAPAEGDIPTSGDGAAEADPLG